MSVISSQARERLLKSALKQFAAKGYSGTSIQDIVGAAKVTKPTLYYYFKNKAGIYRALVAKVCDEELAMLQSAVSADQELAEQLANLVWAMFRFAAEHHDAMRVVFATAFAAIEEVPLGARCEGKGWQSMEWIEGLLQHALNRGELRVDFDASALTMAFCGIINLHVMSHLLHSEKRLTRKLAGEVVSIFLGGASRLKSSAATNEKFKEGKRLSQ